MIDNFLKRTLEKYLGFSSEDSKGNISFKCPFKNHRKGTLSVLINTDDINNFGFWHCWACSPQKSGKSIEKLLSLIGINNCVIDNIHDYIDVNIKKRKKHYKCDFVSNQIKLPDEFYPLYKERNSIEYKNALYYVLKKRKLTVFDILRYNIGYCENGEFEKRIIIPSYDLNGDLNYFTARAYYDEDKFPYLNPKISKNVIGFELFINWELPIVLVEGIFDAIAIRRNSIPLFGKEIPEVLRLKIITENVSDIVLGLDPDAIKKSIEYINEFLNEGRNVYLLNFSKKDPSEEGYANNIALLNNSKKIKFSDLIKLKLMKESL
jgi:DNA primase